MSRDQMQGTLTEREGSVRLTSSLDNLVLSNSKLCLQYQKQLI